VESASEGKIKGQSTYYINRLKKIIWCLNIYTKKIERNNNFCMLYVCFTL